ncbi:hypothetical protein PCASD_24126 [Puccinia coronata f. sp. avenae]|uniref:Uncharacterized protein n=1 Tax=Puccinia coronata f. sp. avenae TaxID=200324 RepID=A0A2N5SJ52_9BASI|nr:hypothetical protein PCASD_24126 [Puccinia coronata f. sp. avenae]
MIGPTDISFFNTQNSEWASDPPNEDGQVTRYKVYYDPEPPEAAPSKATPTTSPGLRHTVAACGCIVRCIKAPLLLNSAMLKAGHATQAHDSLAPPKIPSIKMPPPPSNPVVRPSLHYELICWYHEMQWRHTHRGRLLNSPEATKSFWEYIDHAHDYKHINIFLLGIPLKKRNKEYHCLEISKIICTCTHIKLDDLLKVQGMSKPLYIKIGQMMAGERVPAVSLESLAGYHGP